ncbi:hypothetical protein IIA15_09200 [candidate division TA06 bacterium]|nr:hypothetical protein [candidate division TA06 bacterium]
MVKCCKGIVFLLFLLFAVRTFGLPAFASYEGTPCATCHVNPTGGGMRRDMGFIYGVHELPYSEKAKVISPKIAEGLKIGADFRHLAYAAQSTQFQGTKNTFLTMQGDIYLHYNLGENLEFYLDKGLYQGFEVMAILSKEKPYLKIGRFLPPYGLRFDDHNVYTLSPPGSSTPFSAGGFSRGEDSGIEVGYMDDNFIAALAVQNGRPGPGFQFDFGEDEGKAVTATIKGFQKHFLLGGSYYRNFQRFPGTELEFVGGHGGIHYGKFNLITQVDYMVKRDAPSDTINADNIVSHTEARYRAKQGIDLLLQYDFFDVDSLEAPWDADFERISLGTALFPIRYLEVLFLTRFNLYVPKDEAWEANLLFHLFF